MTEVTTLLAEIKKAKTDPNQLIRLSKRIDLLSPDAIQKQGFISKKIAILGGYTSPFLAALLRVSLLEHRIFAQVFESEYGLFEQAIYSKDLALAAFAPDLCYFYVGSDHLSPDSPGWIEAESSRWTALWRECHSSFNCEIIHNTFEEPQHRTFGNFEAKMLSSPSNKIRALNTALAQEAPAHVHFCDVNALAGQYGRKIWRDERLYDMSKIPVAFEFWEPYAENLAAVCAGVWGRSKKCLVLDLDNTLWGGVIGDDGVAGIRIGEDGNTGESFLRFQKYLRSLKERGVILAVASKNEESIAKDAFQKRTEMVLKLEDFSVFFANWDPKPRSIAAIAKQLNIGLDALVFVDDNPAERQLVREQLPEVSVVEMPEDPSQYTATLSATKFFETVSITSEDLMRTSQYQANAFRDAALLSATDYDSYLRGLTMTSTVAPFDEIHLPRITQLIGKTNQFNVTTPRYTEAETASFATNPQAITRYVTLADRFGDNGLISVFIGLIAQDSLTIDTWLMSCRVLKRGVENFLFREIVAEANKRGIRQIKGTYKPTVKNKLVENLFSDLGFILENKNADGISRWIFDLTDHKAVGAVLKSESAIQRSNV